MAAISPSTDFLPRTITIGLPGRDRLAIERQIEMLIDLLDSFDGDADLEPDHEDYDACDLGEPVLTSDILPAYGEDQSTGPLNAREVFGVYADSVTE